MPTLNDVLAGSLAQAVQVQQIIDALKGTPNKGVPVALVSLNDQNNYALTVQNDDPINSRALSVLKSDGTTLISADATGVTLGAPVNLQASSISGTSLANASVTNAKLASDTARANLLTNGGLEIWQRGAGPFSGAIYSADRWGPNVAGGDTISVSRDSANADASQYCAAITYTRVGGGTNYSQYLADLLPQLKGRTISLSARVKCSTANAARLRIYDGSVVTFGAYHTGGGAYETLTVTRAMPAGATYLSVDVALDLSCTVYLDNVMLVLGSVAADYAPLQPADDLARCLRYYESWATGMAYQGISQCISATQAYLPWTYRVQKVTTPTVTSVNPTSFIVLNATGGTPINPSTVAPGTAGITTSGTMSTVTVASGLVAGNAAATAAGSNGNLLCEANP